MIRCEKCGHKLKDDQTVCEICNTPVRKVTDDFEFEEELARSIAQIVENETSDAKVYMKQLQATLDKEKGVSGTNSRDRDVLGVSMRSTHNEQKVRTQGSTSGSNNTAPKRNASSSDRTQNGMSRTPSGNGTARNARPVNEGTRQAERTLNKNVVSSSPKTKSTVSSSKKKKKKAKVAGKIAAIISLTVVVLLAIVGLAFYTIKYFFSKAEDSYVYYNNTAVTYYNEGNYSDAIPYFQQAMSYEEANNNIPLRLALYDCYVNTGDDEKAITMLYNILSIDEYNLEAIVSLEGYFERAGSTTAIKDLYDKYKGTPADAAVSKYFVEAPKISVVGGNYSNDLEVTVSSDYSFDIYYTTDGTEPTVYSYKYSGYIPISEGTTELKCVAANSYGMLSDVVSEKYVITYEKPKAPTATPKSGNYTTEQIIVIGNIPAGGKAYYTLDGSKPNKYSTPYEGPFDMPEGDNILSIIVYDKNGLYSDITQKNYVLTLEDKITRYEGEQLLWKAMEEKNMVTSDHRSSDGEPVELDYFDKLTITDKNGAEVTLWAFKITVTTMTGKETANYMMGTDSSTGFVYTIYDVDGGYLLDRVMY